MTADDLDLALLRTSLVSESGGPSLTGRRIAQVALAARRGEVAVLAFETVPALRLALAAAAQKQRRVDALLELGLAHAAGILAAQGLSRVALLKGSAASAWAYPETCWRFRRDIDLLVGDSLVAVRDALLAGGWRDDVDPVRLAAGPRRTRAWPMVRPLGQTQVSLDLHRALVETPAWCHPEPEALLDESVAGVNGRSLRVTSLRDTILHTVLHLVGNGFHEPLKGWLDLVRLMAVAARETTRTTTPERLAERADRFGLRASTWLCLKVAERWFAPLQAPSAAIFRPYREALEVPRWQQTTLASLASGDGTTPERWPLRRGWSRRLWQTAARDR